MSKINLKNNSGIASVLVLGVAIIILIVGIALYGYQTGDDGIVMDSIRDVVKNDEQNTTDDSPEISQSDDIEALEAELEATVVGSPDNDFAELEEDIGEL